MAWLDTRGFPLVHLSLSDGGPRSAGWREHGERRRKFDFDLRGERGGCGEEDGRVGGGTSQLRRCRGLDGFEDDKDGLPEWCLDDEDEEMGTFDASGAFLPLKVLSSGRLGGWQLPPAALPLCPRRPFPHRRAPRSLFLRSKSLISRAWRKRKRSRQKGRMRRGPRQVSRPDSAVGTRPEGPTMSQSRPGSPVFRAGWVFVLMLG